MDGFDLERFKVGGLYEVDVRLAQYLVLAGYARANVKDEDSDARRAAHDAKR